MPILLKVSSLPKVSYFWARYKTITQNVSALQHIKEPNNVEEFKHFLGLTGYYRKFMLLFAGVTKPLNKLLRKYKIPMVTAMLSSLWPFQQALCREPILQSPTMEKYTFFHLCQALCLLWHPHPGSWQSWGSQTCCIFIWLILWNAAKVVCN